MATNIFKLQAVRPAAEAPLFVYLPRLLTSSYKTDRSITVDWGDGTVETVARSSEISGGRHEVTKEGLYAVSLTYSDDMVLAINSDDYNDPHFFCSYVTEVTLAENIALTDYALSGCPQLTKVTMLGATPPKLWEHTLTQNANLTAIYVPYSAVNTYKTAAVWSTFADIIRGYFPMKVVTSGAHYTTVEVDTAEAVKFSFPSTSLSVEASGGDITVALTETAQAGDDETITVPDGESRMFIHHRMNVDTYYLTGSGTAKLYASNMGDVNPFERKGKGGDSGGDNTHYKGTTTTPLENGSTTNPIVIDGESYTAVFGDVVVYDYTEFVFDGTAWSEFGRPFDTTPTLGSMNAVTSNGIFLAEPLARGTGNNSALLKNSASIASGAYSVALGNHTRATQPNMMAIGAYNQFRIGDLLNIGNGNSSANSNIVEVNYTSANVNGDIKINNVAIPTPYTTMPTIAESMLGQIAMYVGATDANYTQGCFYIASTDGAAEPTYSWVKIGSNYREVELYSNDEHAATPVNTVITLSQDWADFDAIGFVSEHNSEVGLCAYNEYKVSALSAISQIILNFDIGANANSAIFLSKNTSNSFVVNSITAPPGGLSHVYKIIGIKY